MLARTTLFDSLMVKWLYGLVWSVVCYFNFLCLLLTSLTAVVGVERMERSGAMQPEKKMMQFCLCADFLKHDGGFCGSGMKMDPIV